MLLRSQESGDFGEEILAVVDVMVHFGQRELLAFRV